MEKAEGIGETANRLIRKGATNQEALAEVMRIHPDAKTTLNCIRWYRSKLVCDFEDVPSSRQAPGLSESSEMPPPTPAQTAADAVPSAGANGEMRTAALALLRDLLRQWRTNDQALSLARQSYPSGGVSSEDVRTVRAELRRAREYVPTSAEARRFQIGEPRPTDPVPPKAIMHSEFWAT